MLLRTRFDVVFSKDFRGKVLSVTEDVEDSEVEFIYVDIPFTEIDEEIIRKLPGRHVFEAAELRNLLSQLLKRQPFGMPGSLLNNGDHNLFPFYGDSREVMSAFVYWNHIDSYWFVVTENDPKPPSWHSVRVFAPLR